MNRSTALLCGAALAMVIVVPAGRADERPLLKLFAPETWEATVGGGQQNLDTMARSLIAVAGDEKRSHEDRRKAILLLGKIGNQQALDFLTTNVALDISPKLINGDYDLLRSRPCHHALLRSKGNWNVAKAILKALDSPKNERELMLLLGVFHECMGANVGLAVIEQELAKRPKDDRKKNLEFFWDNFPK